MATTHPSERPDRAGDLDAPVRKPAEASRPAEAAMDPGLTAQFDRKPFVETGPTRQPRADALQSPYYEPQPPATAREDGSR
jgi:hypothetical protein